MRDSDGSLKSGGWNRHESKKCHNSRIDPEKTPKTGGRTQVLATWGSLVMGNRLILYWSAVVVSGFVALPFSNPLLVFSLGLILVERIRRKPAPKSEVLLRRRLGFLVLALAVVICGALSFSGPLRSNLSRLDPQIFYWLAGLPLVCRLSKDVYQYIRIRRTC